MPTQASAKAKTAKAKAARKSSGRVTTASEWKKDAQKGKPVPLTVPSGKTCLVQRPQGIQAFLSNGTVPNALMPIIQEALDKADGKEKPELDKAAMTKDIMGDPERLASVFEMMDLVTIETVVEPKVYPIPVDEEGVQVPAHLRDDDDKLYVDYIDQEDKMFIMNFAMEGQSEIEPFRAEVASTVEAVSSVEGVGQDTE